MLDLTEDALRYNQAGQAVLDLTARSGVGSNVRTDVFKPTHYFGNGSGRLVGSRLSV